MKSKRNSIVDAAVLHAMVLVSWAVIEIARRRCGRTQRAVDSLEAAYQFSAGRAARLLIFSAGRVKTKRGRIESPDYEVILIDPCGAVVRMAKNPNDVFKLLVENKIEQRGNHYYLFKFGYLLSLSRRYFENSLIAITPPMFRKKARNET